MRLSLALLILFVAWPASEIALAFLKRARGSVATRGDRGSIAVLWIVIAVSIFVAVPLQLLKVGRLGLPFAVVGTIGLILMLGGIAVRWHAILTLGRFFTVDVAVRSDHRIVRSGLYSRIRHPAYTGLMMTFLGLGVSLQNWLSVGVIVLPISAALLYRIRVEERLLRETFGEEYVEYSRTTKRLIPGVY
jgi:protein-S-isoprenylcysteine O-methyltransferase Ste14